GEEKMDVADEELENAAASGAQDQLQDDQNQATENDESELPETSANKNTAPAFGLHNKQGKDAVQLDSSQNEADEQGEGDESEHQQMNRDAMDRPANFNKQNSSQTNDGGASNEGAMHDTRKTEQTPQPQQRTQEPPNPFKARGDISEHWFRHLNVQAR